MQNVSRAIEVSRLQLRYLWLQRRWYVATAFSYSDISASSKMKCKFSVSHGYACQSQFWVSFLAFFASDLFRGNIQQKECNLLLKCNGVCFSYYFCSVILKKTLIFFGFEKMCCSRKRIFSAVRLHVSVYLFTIICMHIYKCVCVCVCVDLYRYTLYIDLYRYMYKLSCGSP